MENLVCLEVKITVVRCVTFVVLIDVATKMFVVFFFRITYYSFFQIHVNNILLIIVVLKDLENIASLAAGLILEWVGICLLPPY